MGCGKTMIQHCLVWGCVVVLRRFGQPPAVAATVVATSCFGSCSLFVSGFSVCVLLYVSTQVVVVVLFFVFVFLLSNCSELLVGWFRKPQLSFRDVRILSTCVWG